MARSVGVIVAFATIAILIGIHIGLDLQRDGLLLTEDIILDLAGMLVAMASAGFQAVRLVRERRMHEEILRNVIATIESKQ